jgi:hypothetical protein
VEGVLPGSAHTGFRLTIPTASGIKTSVQIVKHQMGTACIEGPNQKRDQKQDHKRHANGLPHSNLKRFVSVLVSKVIMAIKRPSLS